MATATLLLNSSYEPLKVIPWYKAITLALLDKADILETYEGETLRSAHGQHPWPAVARLRSRVPWRTKGVKFNRINVYRRDDFTCQFCGTRCSVSKLTFDHVVPRAQGGETSWTNIVTACYACNQKKGARTPKQANMQLLSTPKEPKWFQTDLAGQTVKVWEPYLWA
jgi:5-methylcytosine-specific restriction endonuclease McrA